MKTDRERGGKRREGGREIFGRAIDANLVILHLLLLALLLAIHFGLDDGTRFRFRVGGYNIRTR